MPTASQITRQAWQTIAENTTAFPASPESVISTGAAPGNPKIPWGIARVNASAAWAKGLDGSGIKVGIVDTGIDLTHPDLAGNIADSYNAIDNSLSANDDHGHGTHVAGTIAGMGVGDKGVYGVAPKARIYAAKVLNANGNGSLANVVDGINWTVGQNVNVINMSIGADAGSDALAQAVQAAHDAVACRVVIVIPMINCLIFTGET